MLVVGVVAAVAVAVVDTWLIELGVDRTHRAAPCYTHSLGCNQLPSEVERPSVAELHLARST